MNTKFKVGDYVKHIVSFYRDENETEKIIVTETRYYLILKVFEDNYGVQYRCQRFIDGVAENYTTIINAGLLDNAEIIVHIDFSPIEKRV